MKRVFIFFLILDGISTGNAEYPREPESEAQYSEDQAIIARLQSLVEHARNDEVSDQERVQLNEEYQEELSRLGAGSLFSDVSGIRLDFEE